MKVLTIFIFLTGLIGGGAQAQNSKGQVEPDSYWSDFSKGFEWFKTSKSLAATDAPSLLDIADDSLNSTMKSQVDQAFDPDVHRILILAHKRKIIHRKYNQRWVNEKSRPTSASMTKSLTGLAVGKALCTGAIKSLDDEAGIYSPRLSGTSWGNAKVRHILAMSSGSNKPTNSGTGSPTREIHQETTQKSYEGRITVEFMELMRSADEKFSSSGQQPFYNNFDTQALAILIEDATGIKFIDFFEREIWKPAGGKEHAKWFANTHGQVTAFTGFTSHPYDWIRLANYVLEERAKNSCFGNYLKEASRRQSTIRLPNAEATGYGYQTWINCAGTDAFCFVGHGGQRVVMSPSTGAIMYMHSTTLVGSQTLLPVYKEFVKRYQ
jgi:CubicO group peptidase (beta-lactamase class C family)